MKAIKGKKHSGNENNYVYSTTDKLMVRYKLNPSSIITHWWFSNRLGIRDKQYSILFEGVTFKYVDSNYRIKEALTQGNKI